ncbi:hypothetical protein VCRA2116O29_890008 [Vibrio crassostreae]|nr:hypothetical protein VCRA2116O29_890008 [Vibrio crassostreae]CAK2572891.1 hypothetical protein VCRA2119O48_840008 [Vibrio crassostreae]CAK3074112.1 hypothetical protein VCRA2133E348_620007 [Vibrio crassostreae]CAK3588785.1 hypothetical protein VCRA213O314_650007 [Vibrio crassostreae]CAK3930404.1 hypothetical protein VCRA2123O74_900007 [Vibrio crassostreae]
MLKDIYFYIVPDPTCHFIIDVNPILGFYSADKFIQIFN